jgi:hypothetical protein
VHAVMSAERIVGPKPMACARQSIGLQERGARRLPVPCGEGRPVGKLTRDDALRVRTGEIPRSSLRSYVRCTRGQGASGAFCAGTRFPSGSVGLERRLSLLFVPQRTVFPTVDPRHAMCVRQ